MDIFKMAENNRQAGWNILEKTGVIRAWESIGAVVFPVGSLKTGLMMKSLDIDLHIYTEKLSVAESFAVMQGLTVNCPFREVQFRNLADTEEECFEWHAGYEDSKGNHWKFDMIHIRKGSRYDGVVEKVTDALIRKLTPEQRRIILQIKFDRPDTVQIPGIEIYHAVLAGGIKDYKELTEWRKTSPFINSLEWMP